MPPLLKFVTSVQAPGTQKFIAKDAFGPDNPDGIKFFLGGSFKKNFLGKIEENVEPTTIAIHRLEKPSLDPEIMAKLRVKKQIIKLANFHQLIKAQSQGQKGSLLVDGYANIAYIEGEDDTIWTVGARWDSDDREWSVGASSVGDPRGCAAGRRVLSQV